MSVVHVAVASSRSFDVDVAVTDAATRRLPPARRADVLARRALAGRLLAQVAPGAAVVHRAGGPPTVTGHGDTTVSVTAAAGTVAAAVAATPVGIDLVDLRAPALTALRGPGETLHATAARWAQHEATLKFEAVGGQADAAHIDALDVGDDLLLVVVSTGGRVERVDLTSDRVGSPASGRPTVRP